MQLVTDRNFLKILVLSLLTCGIYGLINTHHMIKDLNVIAADDGKVTPGLFKLILLSTVTCGIYGIVWYYKFGDRIENAGKTYGIDVKANGTVTLLLILIGAAIAGIGPMVWLFFVLQDLNNLSWAYNDKLSTEVVM